MQMRKRLLALTAALLATSSVGSAWACWDGFSASVGRVSFSAPGDDGDAVLRFGTARALARWGAKLDALVPAGHTLEVAFGQVRLCNSSDDCKSFEHQDWWDASADTEAELNARLARLFRRMVAELKLSAAAKSALRKRGRLFTVQLASFKSRRAAQKMVESINHQHRYSSLPWEHHTFYSAGGFPAMHDVAYLARANVAGRGVFHRVIVGAFTTAGEAIDHQKRIQKAGRRASIASY